MFMRNLFFISSFLLSSVAWAQQSSLQSTRPLIFTKPQELDWRSVKWDTLNYGRTAVDGGAAIYTIPSASSAKFKVTFVFPGGVYSLPKEDRTQFGALSDLLLLGGFGNLNYEQVQNYLTEYAINLQTSVSPQGNLVISADALNEDFPRVRDLLSALISSPRFDEKSFDIWKLQSQNAFVNLMDSNTLEKQMRFLDNQANVLAFGRDHYFSTSLFRISPREIDKVSSQKVKELYRKSINRNGLDVFFSGMFSQSNIADLEKLISSIPRLEPAIKTWIPARDLVSNTNKVRAVIIKKNDMTQSNVTLRYYFPNLGKLNPIEKTRYDILQQIFSSTGGVVGNDRFSKALRADSGISYSPHSYFVENAVEPNTNVGMFTLNFQSPNERLAEAVELAQKTWNTFLNNGVTQQELDNTRSALINRLLATELTVFDKADNVMSKIAEDKVPSADPVELELVKLDQQRDVLFLNKILSNLTREKLVPVLVIMGNPDEKQVAELKKVLNLDAIEQKTVRQIVESL